MRISKESFSGTGKVYRFTLKQMVAGTSNKITLLILLLLAFLSVPAISLFRADSAREEGVEGISEEQQRILNAGYTVEVLSEEEYREAGVEPFNVFTVQYGYSILVMMVSVFVCSYIVRSVIEEKASCLVEMLMVSVRPLALLIGKILAALTFIFGSIVLLLAAFLLSLGVCGRFMDVSAVSGMLSGLGADFAHVPTLILIAVFIALVLSFLLFAFCSGLSGVCCSSMEDVEAATLSVTLLILAGYLVSCFTALCPPAVRGLFSLLPVLSAFCAPVFYIIGELPGWLLIVSFVLQAFYIAALAWFCMRVYQDLILYRGRRVRLLSLWKRTGGVRA